MKKLVLALAAVAMIATPALADVTPYGSARVAAVYVNSDDGTDTISAFDMVLQGNSRFGIKANTGDVTGRIEFGTGVNTRLLYGTVKLGAGTFLVGQTYTPQTKFSNQALNQDLGFIGFGALYDGRQPMLKYDMDSGVYFAAIKNGKLDKDADYIPKLVAGFKGKAGSINFNAGAGFQKYNQGDTAAVAAGTFFHIDNDSTSGTFGQIIPNAAVAATEGDDVTSYLLFVCGDAKFGDWGFIYGLHYGQNLGDYGISGRSDSAMYTAGKDSTGYGLMLEADIAGFAFGAGYVADELDITGADADAQLAVFVNYTVQMAKGFKIVPEITYLDYMEDAAGADEGTDLLVGAKFQMDF